MEWGLVNLYSDDDGLRNKTRQEKTGRGVLSYDGWMDWLLSVSMDGRWIGIGGRYKGGFRFFKNPSAGPVLLGQKAAAAAFITV
jgi:hypothetical protein